ncbi:MAG: hypothetical protein JWN86_4072 [Planctomycetota bacterium]|nr:hypothetical protein [Planctomycetota bacterium]
MSRRSRSPWLDGVLVAAVCAASLAANARLDAPPRFDGAGYAVLARSILERRDYREIDRPDAPRHAHFPPGYPLALAALWSVTGPSAASAHAFSLACTMGATLLAWLWFRTGNRPDVALLMGLALAANWRWGRDGSAIQSEPLFLLLGQAAVLAAMWVADRGGWARGLMLGGLLGAVVLTRHVGLALAAAVMVDLLLSRRYREALATFAAMAAVLVPWVVWLASVKQGTQVELVPVRGLLGVIAENALFYVRRLPDQIVGPIIEVATVFRPAYSPWATLVAALAAAVIVTGWIRLARKRETRLAGLVPLLTMAMLLAWPFTEAGRFLVPLIPFLIVGAVAGLEWVPVPPEGIDLTSGPPRSCWRRRSRIPSTASPRADRRRPDNRIATSMRPARGSPGIPIRPARC